MLGFLNRFVDSNDRELKRIQPFVDEANALEPEIEALSDDEIRARFAELREEIREAAQPDEPSDDELNHPEAERRRELAADRRKRENQRIQTALDDALPESFAMTREAMKRTLGMRHFDVQLHRRRRPPPGQDRRGQDRRGQDLLPDPGGHPQLDDRARRPRRDRQRLPRPPRPAVDGSRSSTSSG